MNNEPVAFVNSMCNDSIDWKIEPMGIDGQPLYTHPAKYCPSENNEAYEKGFIDGMAKMTESAVHRAVEGMSEKTLTDEDAKQKLIRIMGTFDLATGHADTFDELLDSLEVELRDVLGYYREALRKAQKK